MEAKASARWRNIALTFLKLGATSYGGPGIMGIMQAELQDKRRWVSKERFVEGLSLVNMLPGATATQLGIFLAYARGGWWGGLLGGLCFVLPAFAVMLALTIAYASVGTLPLMRGALYGLGPVVLGIFVVAVYRLGRSTARAWTQALIAVAAGVASTLSLLGVAAILSLAGAIGILLFHSRKRGAFIVGGLAVLLVVSSLGGLPMPAAVAMAPGSVPPQGLLGLGAYFFKVGAFTVGGGLRCSRSSRSRSSTTFIGSRRSSFSGLALGQLTPRPVLMLAAYVGYTVAGSRRRGRRGRGVLALVHPHARPAPHAGPAPGTHVDAGGVEGHGPGRDRDPRGVALPSRAGRCSRSLRARSPPRHRARAPRLARGVADAHARRRSRRRVANWLDSDIGGEGGNARRVLGARLMTCEVRKDWPKSSGRPAACTGAQQQRITTATGPRGLVYQLCRAPEADHADADAALHSPDSDHRRVVGSV